MNNKFISLTMLSLAGYTFYRNYISTDEEAETENGSGGAGSSGSLVNRDIGSSSTTSPNTKKPSFTTDDSISIEGVPQNVVNDAVKLTRSHKSSGSKKKVSFDYDSKTQKNIISLNNKKVGEYDYKNNISKDYSIKTKKVSAKKKKESFSIGGVKLW